METIKIRGVEYPISGYKIINGKRVPVIKAKAVETKHPDGRVDVEVFVPPLDLSGNTEG